MRSSFRCLWFLVILSAFNTLGGEPAPVEKDEPTGLWVGPGLGAGGVGVGTGYVPLPTDTISPEEREVRVQLDREYSYELIERLLKDRKFAELFAKREMDRHTQAASLALQVLSKLDQHKPEDQLASIPLVRLLGHLKDSMAVSEIARFLDTPDPDFPKSIGGVKFGEGNLLKYPAKNALEKMGITSIPILQKIVLFEAHDTLRVKLALHTLMVLQEAKTVEKWVWEDPSLRKDDKRRNALQKLAKELRTTYFAEEKK